MSFLFSILFVFNLTLEAKVFESGEAQINVLELYSSEGCSSCPPADKWLGSLKKHPKLWKSFVPIEFHVDYWNRLGWTDPFSTKQFSNRQRSYSREWKVDKIYTPGFVLNGSEWKPRNQAFAQRGKRVGNLKAEKVAKSKYKIHFSPKDTNKKTYRLFAVLLGNGLVTKVPRGENAGRTLEHEFVVLDYEQKALKPSGKAYVGEIEIRSLSKTKPKSLSVAFWVSEGQSLKPIQAVGGPL